MNEIKYLKSPINYTGSKYRILKYLLPLFPNNINTFVDLFGGAGNVSINVKANKIIYNEIIHFIPQLFNYWKQTYKDEINNYIDKTIIEYSLNGENKLGFETFRNHYNETNNIQDLFILLCYSFNYQIRFNNKHEYNSSFGKSASTMNNNIRNNLNLFLDFINNNNIKFLNNDFRNLKIDKLTSNDFVYLDPPYLVSCGVYQDGKRGFNGWCQQDDIDLMNLCDKLNGLGIKFGISNMLESKGIKNQKLIEWSNKYNIHYINKTYNGANYQRNKQNKDVEVFICNYEVNNEN